MKHMMSVVSALVTLGMAAGMSGVHAQSGTPPAPRLYNWFAQFVAVDAAAKTLTVTAPIAAPVATYLDRFKPGDHLMVTWTVWPGMQDTGPARYIETYSVMKESKVDSGYILPMEFGAGDAAAKTVTFKTAVPAATLPALQGFKPGQWIKLTAPMSQPSEAAVIASLEAVTGPPPPPPAPESDEKPSTPAAPETRARPSAPPAQ